MSETTRKNFLDQLVSNPTTYGGVHAGNGPQTNTDVTTFLNVVAANGAGAAGNTQKTVAARYAYMSINAGTGRGASNDNVNFTRPVGEFFCMLFREVRDRTGHQLNKSDLWHGHLVQTRASGVCVVFHAKEYPKDVDVDRSSANKSGNFSSEDDAYRWRNVLWKASDNKIYKIDAGVYRQSTQTLVHRSPLFDNVIEDVAQEWDLIAAAYGVDKRAARTLEQEELGRQRVDLYYLMNESFLTWKSSHIVMVAKD
jgi:hypothetical protein